jgi:Domain of unknown function DUF11/Bacterial Ig domain
MFLKLPSSAFIVLLVACLFLWAHGVCSAQNTQRVHGWIELLTLNGGTPNLSPTEDAVTSYKITELFQRGTTRVSLMKGLDPQALPELPIGYTVFESLIFSVKTDAVFVGPADISFHLPSIKTKETFDRLRILYAHHDSGDPLGAKWIDATVDDDNVVHLQRTFSPEESKRHLRDFDQRTLHAFTEQDEPGLLVVALWDPAKVRDKFTADVAVSGTGPAQVTEGRLVKYELKVTNNGPDTATGIILHAYPAFQFVSADASQGRCIMAGQNVYCKFPTLEKGRAVDVKMVFRCPWGANLGGPASYEKSTPSVLKAFFLGSTEKDPFPENNELMLTTDVFPDTNKAPVVELVSPAPMQLFQGPAATVPIRIKASDPDGFIKKVEVFEGEKSLGEATLRSDGEYELLYENAAYGDHSVTIIATDNLGRFETVRNVGFFVNGTARVEITSPKAGSKVDKGDGELTVVIHATSSTPLKKVSLDFWQSDATPVGNDDYVFKLKNCYRPCRLHAIAIDQNGVESRSEFVEFTILKPPATTLSWLDGESRREFDTSTPLKASELILVGAGDRDEFNGAEIKKVEIFANGELLCADDSPAFGVSGECVWRPPPGKYKLQAVVTDADGAVGKSALIEVIIERP